MVVALLVLIIDKISCSVELETSGAVAGAQGETKLSVSVSACSASVSGVVLTVWSGVLLDSVWLPLSWSGVVVASVEELSSVGVWPPMSGVVVAPSVSVWSDAGQGVITESGEFVATLSVGGVDDESVVGSEETVDVELLSPGGVEEA